MLYLSAKEKEGKTVINARTLSVGMLVAALTLTACGTDDPVRGTVTEKEYRAEKRTPRLENVYRQQCTTTSSKGKTSRSCRQVVTRTKTVIHYTPACYELELTDGREVCVDEDVWNAHGVGDTYDSSKH